MRLRIFSICIAMLFVGSMNLMAQQARTNDAAMSASDIIGQNVRSADFEETDPPSGDIFSVAEFQPQEGVLVRYPFGIPFTLISELSSYTKVITIVANQSEENSVRDQYENNGVNLDNCEFLHAPTDSYWTRDYGPCFVSYGDNEIGIVDWVYNRPRPNDDEIPVALAEYLDLEWFGMDLVTPGGNYMSDGLVAAAATDLIYEENADPYLQNPTLSEEEVDQLMVDYLGVTNHIVTMDPLADYIKHIDCWGKFLDVDKILIGQVPESDPRYENFEAVADFYANTPSGWGHNYEVYRVYTPGGYPATPYTNSLILNNKVFVAQSGSQWDDEAIEAYQTAMPGYEVIGVDYNGWENTDALHCRTHEIADRGMLLLRHTPYYGMEEAQDTYEFNVSITPYSGAALIADSVKLYYKFDDADAWQYELLSHDEGNNYSLSLDVDACVGKVSYYIHAADESGRSENHPYIGAADPHVFTRDVAPQMEISTAVVNLEAVIGETDAETITFTNTCGSTLNVSFELTEASSDWGSVDADEATILNGESFDLNFTADATGMDAGNYSMLLHVESNDPNHSSEDIVVNFEVKYGIGVEKYLTELTGIAPNPFTNFTTFKLNVKEDANVRIDIYNLQGQRVSTLVNEVLYVGQHQLEWNGTDENGTALKSGMYFYTIQTGAQLSSGKIIKK